MTTLTTTFGQRKFANVVAATLFTTGQSRSDEYLAQAAECQGIADGWSDLVKQQYEALARQWLMLAEQAGLQNASFEAQLALEAELQHQAAQTADFHEGITAFLEKRPPRFSGA